MSDVSTEALGVESSERDPYVDLIRAFSLLVVVLWHWVFTILAFTPGGPRATSPLQWTYALWPLTWVFQVMPLFFFVGGFAHLMVWRKTRARGGSWAGFVWGRLRRLLPPALILIGFWLAVGLAAILLAHNTWVIHAALLIISPLWFLGIYLILVLIAPMMIWLHERWGALILVFLVGLAAQMDILRFARDATWAGLVNLVCIWAFCHQLGFFYRTMVDAYRRLGWMMLFSGMFTLLALTGTGLYPRSMVGVPGDDISNMGPPTLAMVGLVMLQAGLALLLRPAVLRRLESSRRWQWFNTVANNFALPVYLFHTTGMAIAIGLLYLLFGYLPPSTPDLAWWLTRPLWLLLPLLCTLPIIYLFSGRVTRKQRSRPVAPAGEDAANPEHAW